MDANQGTRAGKIKRDIIVSILILILSLLILVFHINYYFPFISDDALISLRYADRMLQGDGLTWTDGKPVEGYSNLLWILLLLPLAWLGVDLITATRVLGFVCLGLLIAALIYYTHAVRRVPPIPKLAGAMTLTLAAPIAVWTIGGLEQPLVACLMAWALVLCLKIIDNETTPAKYAWSISFCLALLTITRLDGILFAGSFIAGVVTVKGINRLSGRLSMQLISLPVIFYLGQQVFRVVYYGEWVANVALVKISPSWYHLSTGVKYLRQGLIALSPVSEITILFILLALIWRRGVAEVERNRAVFLAMPALIWSGYIVFIGGDVFPAWRHFVPLLVIMALLAVECASWFQQYIKTHVGTALFFVFCILSFGLLASLQFTDPENQRARHERGEWDGQVVGLMLKEGFREAQPLMAVTVAGCLPYWSGLPSLDMLGLNDYHIPRHTPDDFGQGWLGHELGDGDYVLSRQPDLIIFTGSRGSSKALFKSGREMQSKPQFYAEYTPATFEGRTPRRCRSLIWVRRYSDKIGIQVTDTSVLVPAYLINATAGTVTYLNSAGQFVISISSDLHGAVGNLRLHPGYWRLSINPPQAVRATVQLAETTEILVEAVTPCTLRLPDTSDVKVILRPLREESTEIHELKFSWAPEPTEAR